MMYFIKQQVENHIFDHHKYRNDKDAEEYRIKNTNSDHIKSMFEQDYTEEYIATLIKEAILDPTYRIERKMLQKYKHMVI